MIAVAKYLRYFQGMVNELRQAAAPCDGCDGRAEESGEAERIRQLGSRGIRETVTIADWGRSVESHRDKLRTLEVCGLSSPLSSAELATMSEAF
jgi:hypothetical protein